MNRISFLFVAVLVLSPVTSLRAQEGLNDLEMAHAAVTANNSDIAYAHIALAFSENPAVREFAEIMIRDHTAVNNAVFALAKELNVQTEDNAFSQQLAQNAARIKDELSRLRGTEFDHYYAENELRYHEAVNDVVANTFIPSVQNPEVKQAFETALSIFRGHQQHAEQVVNRVLASR